MVEGELFNMQSEPRLQKMTITKTTMNGGAPERDPPVIFFEDPETGEFLYLNTEYYVSALKSVFF